jgi:hypothetical protein
MMDFPVSLSNGETRTNLIAPKRPYTRFTVKRDQTITILKGETEVEVLTVGVAPLNFDPEMDDRILYIIGGPVDFVLADYSDFYVKDGEAPLTNPKIRDIVSIRDKATHRLRHNDQIWWPHQTVPERIYSGEGWSGSRIIRMVPVSQDIADEQLADYLNYELERQFEERQNFSPKK